MKLIDQNKPSDRFVFVTQLRPFIAEYNLEEMMLENSYTVDGVLLIKRRNYRPGQTVALNHWPRCQENPQNEDLSKLDDAINIAQCFKFTHLANQCTQEHSLPYNYRICNSDQLNCLLACQGRHVQERIWLWYLGLMPSTGATKVIQR